MAFRIVNKISSNIQITGLVKNSSYATLSTNCFTINPTVETENRKRLTQRRERRSLSYPAASPNRCALFQDIVQQFQQRNSFASTVEHDTEDDEYLEREDLEYIPDEDLINNTRNAESQLHTLRKNTEYPKTSVRLQPNQQTPYLEKEIIDQGNSPQKKALAPKFPYTKQVDTKYDDDSTIIDNEIPIEKPYYLRDSYYDKENDVVDLYSYFSKKYEMLPKTVIPHLQPSSLQPFGSGANPIFPSALRRRPLDTESHKYHVQEREVVESPLANTVKGSSSKTSQEREYSTNANLQKRSVTRFKSNIQLQPQSHFSSESGENLSSVTGQHKPRKLLEQSSSDSHVSSNLDTNNNNTDTKYKIQVYSGSLKQHEDNKKPSASNFNYQNLLNVRTLHEENAIIPDLPSPQTSSPSRIKRKKYSFDTHIELPEVVESSIKIKKSPVGNLLQTNLLPESGLLSDEVGAEKNVRIVAPWPSYSERYKQFKENAKSRQKSSDALETPTIGIVKSNFNVSTRFFHKLSDAQTEKTTMFGCQKMPNGLLRLKKISPSFEIAENPYSSKKDVAASTEKHWMATAVQKLYNKIMPDAFYDPHFDETERSKTEAIKEELNALLAMHKKENA